MKGARSPQGEGPREIRFAAGGSGHPRPSGAPLLLSASEASSLFGPGARQGAEAGGTPAWRESVLAMTELAERTEAELEMAFEASFAGDLDDVGALDRLVAQGWGDRPPFGEEGLSEEELAELSRGWGALLGVRLLDALGGSWVTREDPLHASLLFERPGLEFFPAHAILARFLLGTEASLEAGYHRLVELLPDPAVTAGEPPGMRVRRHPHGE